MAYSNNSTIHFLPILDLPKQINHLHPTNLWLVFDSFLCQDVLYTNMLADDTSINRKIIIIIGTVEPAMSSHSYEQPTSYGRLLGHSLKWHFLYK